MSHDTPSSAVRFDPNLIATLKKRALSCNFKLEISRVELSKPISRKEERRETSPLPVVKKRKRMSVSDSFDPLGYKLLRVSEMSYERRLKMALRSSACEVKKSSPSPRTEYNDDKISEFGSTSEDYISCEDKTPTEQRLISNRALSPSFPSSPPPFSPPPTSSPPPLLSSSPPTSSPPAPSTLLSSSPSLPSSPPLLLSSSHPPPPSSPPLLSSSPSPPPSSPPLLLSSPPPTSSPPPNHHVGSSSECLDSTFLNQSPSPSPSLSSDTTPLLSPREPLQQDTAQQDVASARFQAIIDSNVTKVDESPPRTPPLKYKESNFMLETTTSNTTSSDTLKDEASPLLLFPSSPRKGESTDSGDGGADTIPSSLDFTLHYSSSGSETGEYSDLELSASTKTVQKVTFQQHNVASLLEPNGADKIDLGVSTLTSSSDRRTYVLKSSDAPFCKEVVWTPLHPPMSAKELLDSATHYGLPSAVNTKPFYGNPADVQSAKYVNLILPIIVLFHAFPIIVLFHHCAVSSLCCISNHCAVSSLCCFIIVLFHHCAVSSLCCISNHCAVSSLCCFIIVLFHHCAVSSLCCFM